MIGDWVMVKLTQHNTTVTNIDSNSVYTEAAFPLRYDEIEPIPLTPEILEQNGFEDWDGWLCFDTDEFSISWCGTILKIHSDNGTCELVTCMYVHELQHAIKLCGIEKEIKV